MLSTVACRPEAECLSTPETLSPLEDINSSEEEVFHLELSEEDDLNRSSNGTKRGNSDKSSDAGMADRHFTPCGSPPSKRTAMHMSVPYPDFKKARMVAPSQADSRRHDFQIYWKWNSKLEAELSTKNAIHRRSEITVKQRAELLSWLMQVNEQFKFQFDTWCLAACLLDRFLSRRPMKKQCLQLSGCVALFLAAKHEEVNPPEISELYTLCARSYAKCHFWNMEALMLEVLEFRLKAPRVTTFIAILKEHLNIGGQPAADNSTAAAVASGPAVENGLAERAICDPRLAYHLPSRIAEAIVRNVYDWPRGSGFAFPNVERATVGRLYDKLLGELVVENEE